MPTVPTFYVGSVECAHRFPDGRFAIQEGSGESGPQVTVALKCYWDDRWNLIQALRGTCVGTISGGFTRTPPTQLINIPINGLPLALQTNLVCTSTGSMEYIGSGADETGALEGAFAVVPATFSPVPWQFVDGDPTGQNDASGQAWTVTKIKPSAEVYQPSGGTYHLGPFPSTTPLDEASVGFLRANVEIQVTRKFLPNLPLSAINGALGKVNNTTMAFADLTFTGTGGKLLAVAAEESEPYFDCVGNPVMDYTVTYLGRNVASWNSAQDRSGNWQRIDSSAAGTGNPPFGNYDFTSLPR